LPGLHFCMTEIAVRGEHRATIAALMGLDSDGTDSRPLRTLLTLPGQKLPRHGSRLQRWVGKNPRDGGAYAIDCSWTGGGGSDSSKRFRIFGFGSPSSGERKQRPKGSKPSPIHPAPRGGTGESARLAGSRTNGTPAERGLSRKKYKILGLPWHLLVQQRPPGKGSP
jgi:hypothetical protein